MPHSERVELRLFYTRFVVDPEGAAQVATVRLDDTVGQLGTISIASRAVGAVHDAASTLTERIRRLRHGVSRASMNVILGQVD
jgi:hypothetical protein